MKNNKKYKLYLIILLCLTIILILIYFKDKKIDLFSLFNSENDKYYDCKMNNTNNKIKSLTQSIKSVLNGNNIIETPIFTENCTLETLNKLQSNTKKVNTPNTTQFNKVDDTDLINGLPQTTQNAGQDVIPFNQISDADALQFCSNDFTNNIDKNCKNYSLSLTTNNFNTIFDECITNTKTISKEKEQERNKAISDLIDNINTTCDERKSLEERISAQESTDNSTDNLTNFFFSQNNSLNSDKDDDIIPEYCKNFEFGEDSTLLQPLQPRVIDLKPKITRSQPATTKPTPRPTNTRIVSVPTYNKIPGCPDVLNYYDDTIPEHCRNFILGEEPPILEPKPRTTNIQTQVTRSQPATTKPTPRPTNTKIVSVPTYNKLPGCPAVLNYYNSF